MWSTFSSEKASAEVANESIVFTESETIIYTVVRQIERLVGRSVPKM